MEVKVLNKNHRSLLFILQDVPISIANALRRIMIAEVPVMAIEEVIIIENSSPIKDEMLAHRLGFIPLITDLDAYVLSDVCSCGSELGCDRCAVNITLEVVAERKRTIYSKDLCSENSDVVPVSNDIPITRLAPGQQLRFEAYAKLGRGTEHAKWQPVSACSYKYMPFFNIDHERCNACGECVEWCPKKVLGISQDKLTIIDHNSCNFCKDCEKSCPQSPSAVHVEKVNDSVVFYVESTGALSPERIVIEALKILKDKTNEFINQISKTDFSIKT